MSIKNNILFVLNEMRSYEKQFGRPSHSVSLLAVSKKQSIEKIQAAIDANQLAFGESYLQEAIEKILFFKDDRIIWHFIGPIQRNKIKKIAAHFAWVQSISDTNTATLLNNYRSPLLPALNVCIQINISGEQTKSGISPESLFSLAEHIVSLPHLILRGLMAIPAPTDSFLQQKESFHRLHLLFNDLKLKYPTVDTLSMGMSNDLAAAIAEGSTMVRIGTKIFGER